MHLKVIRLLDDTDSTACEVLLDERFLCFGLEDEFREVKVAGETRIPAGVYKIGIRRVGGFHSKYQERFPEFHVGMLQVMNVPNFEYILIHCGNTDEHTAGCLLVGEDINTTYGNMRLSNSTGAYTRLYKAVIEAALADDLTIEYIDNDRGPKK